MSAKLRVVFTSAKKPASVNLRMKDESKTAVTKRKGNCPDFLKIGIGY
jgi:hypothetical protein